MKTSMNSKYRTKLRLLATLLLTVITVCVVPEYCFAQGQPNTGSLTVTAKNRAYSPQVKKAKTTSQTSKLTEAPPINNANVTAKPVIKSGAIYTPVSLVPVEPEIDPSPDDSLVPLDKRDLNTLGRGLLDVKLIFKVLAKGTPSATDKTDFVLQVFQAIKSKVTNDTAFEGSTKSAEGKWLYYPAGSTTPIAIPQDGIKISVDGKNLDSNYTKTIELDLAIRRKVSNKKSNFLFVIENPLNNERYAVATLRTAD